MTKRILAMLATSAAMLSFVGCGGNAPGASQEATEATMEETSEETTEETAEATKETAAETTTIPKIHAGISTSSTTTVSTDKETKKKSSLRIASKSTDKTYIGFAFLHSADIPYYKEPDPNSEVVSYGKSRENVIVSDYMYDDYGFYYFMVPKYNGWSDAISCPLYNYLDVAFDISSRYGGTNSYTVYDIDGDGTNEWIFQIGKYAYQYQYRVYSVKGSNTYGELIGTIPYGSLYADENGNLITQVEKMGYESAYQVEYHNGALNVKLLYEKSGLEEYTKAGETVPIYEVYSLIDSSHYHQSKYNEYDLQDEEWDESPNVFCPKCGHGEFITGVGTEGIKCPECGAYIIDPVEEETEAAETVNSDHANAPTDQNADWTTEDAAPQTDAPIVTEPVAPDPVEPDPIEPETDGPEAVEGW